MAIISLVSVNIDRYMVGHVRARYVNPTPADLGGVMSFLYELEHSAKPSLPVWGFVVNKLFLLTTTPYVLLNTWEVVVSKIF